MEAPAGAKRLEDASSAEDRKKIRDRADLRMGALGSGSDYTAFIDHLGVASLNLGYGGEDDGGIYHSIYDSFYWYTQFSDRDFVYGKALAQTVGLVVSAPRRRGPAALRVRRARRHDGRVPGRTEETPREEAGGARRAQPADRRRRLRDDGRRPRRPTVAPPRAEVPPHLEFAPLENAVDALQKSAGRYGKARKAVEGRSLPAETLARFNAALIRSERVLSPEGLLRRPWFKHLLYAPGTYSGYGAKTMPGAREAIELKRYSDAATARSPASRKCCRTRRCWWMAWRLTWRTRRGRVAGAAGGVQLRQSI